MTTDEGIAPSYLRLGMALGRHIPGFVDAYYGPEELSVRAREGSAWDPDALEARELREHVGSCPERFERLITERCATADRAA